MAAEVVLTLRANAAPLKQEIAALSASVREQTAALGVYATRVEAMLDRMGAAARRNKREIESLSLSQRALGGIGSVGAGVVGGIIGAGVAGIAQSALSTGYQAFREQTSGQLQLEAATKRANLVLGDQLRISRQLADTYGLTTAEASQTLAAATRAARIYGRPQDAERLARGAINASLASGQRAGYAREVLQGVIAGTDDQLNKIGLGDPSTLQREFKALNNIKGELTDAQKVQANASALMAEGARNSELAARQANSAAGGIDAATSALTDFAGAIVGLGLSLPPVVTAIQQIRDAARDLRGAVPGASGPGGVTSGAVASGVGSGLLGLANPLILGAQIWARFKALDAEGRAIQDAHFNPGLFGQQGAFGFASLVNRGYAGLAGAGAGALSYGGTGFGIGRAYNAIAGFAGQAYAGLTGAPGYLQSALADRSRLEGMIGAAGARNLAFSSPAAGQIAQGRLEAQQLYAQLQTMSGLLGPQMAQVLAGEGQRLTGSLAQSYAGGVGSLLAIQERQAQFRRRPGGVTGYERGAYGQLTGNLTFGADAYGETTQERISRILSSQGKLAGDLYSGLGAYDEDQRRAISGRYSRQFALQGLSGFRPEDFTAAQRAEYQKLLEQGEKDQLAELTLMLNEMKTISNDVKALKGRWINAEGNRIAEPATFVTFNEIANSRMTIGSVVAPSPTAPDEGPR